MKFARKTLGLLLVCLALASCGGGGGDGHSAVGPPQNSTITLTPTRLTLPQNTVGAAWFPNSPFSSEVDINWRYPDGSPVSGHDLSCSISPIEVASIHVPDDPTTTPTPDESQIDYTNVQVHSDTGHALCWVFAQGRAGTAVLSVGGVDPRTGAGVSASVAITIANVSGGLPATVQAQPLSSVYLPGSGGAQSGIIAIQVLDAGGNPVPNPVNGNSGVDNVKVEIVGPSGGATLSGTSVTGPVTGNSITTFTSNGLVNVSFNAGTLEGPIQVRVTVDRSDGNVSNGIADPLSTTTSVVVSDGQLYAVQITSPDTNAILVNVVDPNVTSTDTTDIPPNPDGTYSLTVSAQAVDRQGKPVIPGTSIRFGVIDEPAGTFSAGTSANRFLIAGNDGNPQEGGTLFTAPTGHFRTAGGGAGPGDALIVFGKAEHGAPQGNEDLESALTVATVNSETSLNTTSPFNRNDTTGVSVDNGNVLPYVIGRARHGSITASAFTNNLGVAHAELTYTVSTLGHIAAIWAQGDGTDRVTGGSRRATDAEEIVYPGIAPATVTAFPSPIPGNTTTTVTACIVDHLDSPIQGVRFGYTLALAGGTGSVDGNGVSGVLDNLTGPDGCVNATVVTSGLPASATDGNSGTLTFTAGGASSDPIDIIVSIGFLQSSLASVCTNGTHTSDTTTITAFGTDGHPLSGVQLTAACTGTGLTVAPGSATTGTNGSSVFTISWTISMPPANGVCTFSTAGTGRSVSVSAGPTATSPACP